MPKERADSLKTGLFPMLQKIMEYHYDKDEEGRFYITSYVNYNDYLSEESIQAILTADHPGDAFYETIFTQYLDYTDESIRTAVTEELNQLEEFQKLKERAGTDFYADIQDYLTDHIHTEFPYEHYLNQEVALNLIVDTGDLNTDYTENNLLNYCAPDYSQLEEGEEVLSDTSSLLWLCQSQGISKKELENAVIQGTACSQNVLNILSEKKRLEKALQKLGKDLYQNRYHTGAYKQYVDQKDALSALDKKIRHFEQTYEANSISFSEYQNTVRKKNLPMMISDEADFYAKREGILNNLQEKINAANEEKRLLQKDRSEIQQVKQLTNELDTLIKEKYRPLSSTEDFQKMQFLESVLQESRESTTHMNALTFCVKMPLEKAIRIQEIRNKEKPYNQSYDATDRCGTSFLILDKQVSCGLYDSWNGAGGLFAIQLKNDIHLPLKYIDSMNVDGAIGESLKSIYSMGDEMWTDSVKDVVEQEPDIKQNRDRTMQIPLQERIYLIESTQMRQAKEENRNPSFKER